jgi:hypothetical protein
MIGRNDQWNSYLVFYLDDVVRAGYEQSGVVVEGTYEVTGPATVKLSLPPDRDADLTQQLLGPGDEVYLSFHRDPSGFWYRDYLAVDETNIRWHALGSEPESGSTVHLAGRELVRLDEELVVLSNVKFRTQPTTASAAHVLNETYEAELQFDLDFIPRGERITAIARTTELDVVNDWSNYWYYVYLPAYHSYVFGWVYGELVGPYGEEEAELYREWNQAAWADLYSRDSAGNP